MKTYNFDAFGNPLPARNKTNGKPRPIVLYGDGVYDPALAACYAPVGRRRPATESFWFTIPDNCAGEATTPASLQRYIYAGEAPIDAVDAV
jgi:hypothetical protein